MSTNEIILNQFTTILAEAITINMDCCTIIIICIAVSEEGIAQQIKTKYITQPLDHFASDTTRSFQMRYLERRTYWRPGGPALVHIGGEYPVWKSALKGSGIVRLAIATHGAMFATEHRFYGESVPAVAAGEGVTRTQLEQLSSRQALADLAKFIRLLKSYPEFTKSKVVVAGVSYAGSLASWMRQLYPDLVDAAWSSSAPVLAKLDFHEYYESLGDLYETHGGRSCYSNIRKLFRYQKYLFDTSRVETLKREQGICKEVSLSTPLERRAYFNEYIYGFKRNHSVHDIREKCRIISNFSIAKESFRTIRYSHNLKNLPCMRMSFGKTAMKNPNDIAWLWQVCSEFGWFATTSSVEQPFGNNILANDSLRECKLLFGEEQDEIYLRKKIEETNEMYGGVKPNVTKVVFVNGALDPWRHLSIVEDLSPEVPAVLIQNVGHGADFQPKKKVDSKELILARQKIEELIIKWIL